MNPLTVTWAPLKYTDIGWSNFQAHIQSGLSNILCTPNGDFQRKLARLCFEELGDAFHVFVLGQISYPFQMAVKLGIPLVFYGENHQQNSTFINNYSEKNPLKRLGNSHEIASTALFLASEASSYINGANIVVDGGWSIV